ncbi:hypothetical protein [Streptomyces sp. WG-D5]
MPGPLPVPLACEVPSGWQAAPPEEVGAPHAAFVALHLASRGSGFVPNITVSGQPREGAVDPQDLAEESVRRLRKDVGPVTVVNRTGVGGVGLAPGLTDATGVVQNLRVYAQVSGRPVQLSQSQVLLLVEDVRRTGRFADFEIALTARPDQLAEVLPGFQEFLRTVHPVAPAAGTGTDGQPGEGE